MNTSRSLWWWSINQLIVLAFLMTNLSSVPAFMGFMVAHGIVIFLTFQMLVGMAFSDAYLRKIMGKSLIIVLILMSVVPLVGPAGSLMSAFALKLYPVRAKAKEEFIKVNFFTLESFPLTFVENPSFSPQKILIYLIHGLLPFDEAMHALKLISTLQWSPYKTRLIQLFLEYSRHPSVTLEASRILNEKRNELLERISALESHPQKPLAELATLYHELYFLSLTDPWLGFFYLKRACAYIDGALKDDPQNLSLLLQAIKYHLEKRDLKQAESLLKTAFKLAEDNWKVMVTLKSYRHELNLYRGKLSYAKA
jgi:hypothetical protein